MFLQVKLSENVIIGNVTIELVVLIRLASVSQIFFVTWMSDVRQCVVKSTYKLSLV